MIGVMLMLGITVGTLGEGVAEGAPVLTTSVNSGFAHTASVRGLARSSSRIVMTSIELPISAP